MNMQTQPSMDKGPEQILKKLEARESSPAQMAQEALRQGDTRVAELKTQINELIDELSWDADREQTVLQLKTLQQELGSARTELANDLRAVDTSEIDEDWAVVGDAKEASTGEEGEFFDAWSVALEESDKAFASGTCSPKLLELLKTTDGERAFKQNLEGEVLKLNGQTTDFKSLDLLLTLSKHNPHVAEIVANEMYAMVGKKSWPHLLNDETYRSELETIQNQLNRKVGKKEQPLCRELGLSQLVMLHEMFGKEPGQLAKNVDLATYCSELQLSSGEILVSPVLDPESGLMTGNISVMYEYGDKEDDARMHRHFSSKLLMGDGGYALEKSTTLELITLPDRVKSNNTARQEMTTTNNFLKGQGFSREKLHANIDIGGYAWAAMGFGWDIEKMRREDQKNASKAEIITEFITDRLATVERNLSDSGIDTNAPDIKPILDHIKNRVQDAAAVNSITPQDLACLGKGGPTFIQAKSGNFYRAEDYPSHEKDDPPIASIKGPQHLGKLLLIGSDWYGEKPL